MEKRKEKHKKERRKARVRGSTLVLQRVNTGLQKRGDSGGTPVNAIETLPNQGRTISTSARRGEGNTCEKESRKGSGQAKRKKKKEKPRGIFNNATCKREAA